MTTIVRTLRTAVTPSSYCKFFYLCAQSSGDPVNLVSGGPAFARNASLPDGTAWATAGYLTTAAGTNVFGDIPRANLGMTLVGYTMIFAMRLKKAVPAGNEVVGSTYPAGSGSGIYIQADSGGGLRMFARKGDGTNTNLYITGAIDNTEHTNVFFWPRDAASNGQAWRDGILIQSTSVSTVAGGDITPGADLRIGGAAGGTTSIATQIGSLQMYMVPKDLSSIQAALIADRLARYPDLPLPDEVFA